MSGARFSRYVLRTTAVEAARAFYTVVLGEQRPPILQLPEPALARGARPHWLGNIGATELGGAEAVAARFVQRGALRLGPPLDAGKTVVLRDPGGAVVALTDLDAETTLDIVWHQLNTQGCAAAMEHYAALFGWAFTEQLDLGQLGQHQCFAFGPGEANAGAFSSIESRPQVHPHWLFFFAVDSLDAAIERVRAHGGLVMGPIALPNGGRVAACDDPQGAAFGLIERRNGGELAPQP